MSQPNTAAVLAAYAELEAATEAYHTALFAFQKVYDPKTVGINELSEHINFAMIEIDAELDEVI